MGSSIRRRIGLHARGERFWIVVGYNVAFSFSFSFCRMRSERGCVGPAGRGIFAIECSALAHWVAYVE